MDEYIRLINKAEDYINDNLESNITLDDLAKNACLSKFHFHRLFAKYSNESIKQFIIRIKMERSAIFLLTRKDLSITQIALSYGYSDASSYSKAFKSYYGIAPSLYRSARNDMLNSK